MSDATAASWGRQDPDFRATGILLAFEFRNANDTLGETHSSYDPEGWPLHEDEDTRAGLIEPLKERARNALRPWIDHYMGLGLVRGDGLTLYEGDDGDGPMECSFYLVRRADDVDDAVAELAAVPEIRVDIPELPEVSLVVSVNSFPVNATILFEAARTQGLAAGGRRRRDTRFGSGGRRNPRGLAGARRLHF